MVPVGVEHESKGDELTYMVVLVPDDVVFDERLVGVHAGECGCDSGGSCGVELLDE